MLSPSPHSDPVVPWSVLFPVGKWRSLAMLPQSHDWEMLRSPARPEFLLLRPGTQIRDWPIGSPEGKSSPVFRWSWPSSPLCFSVLQRKSSKAKEKKQKRLEERAAMDAVCAKVDAANRVTLSSFPVPSSWNFSLVLNLTSFGATLWQNRVTTHPHLYCLLAAVGLGWSFGPAWLGAWESCEEDPGWTQACREVWSQEKVAASLCGSVSLPLEKRLEKFLLGFCILGRKPP